MRTPTILPFAGLLIELAHGLGLTTVAEWVQNEEAAKLLAEWGCDYLQGKLTGMAAVGPPPSAKPATTATRAG